MAIIVVGLLIWAIWPSNDSDVVSSKANSVTQVAVENTAGLTGVKPSKEADNSAPELQAASITIDTPIADSTSITSASKNELLLRFVEECWVEVRDKAGRLLLADLKNAGDEVTLVGEPPFKVVIGNVTAIEVFYAGNAIDVAGSGDSNTAKLVIGE
jgi:cytoskeleton protein RodZ